MISKTIKKIITVSILFQCELYAFKVSHQVRPNSSFETTVLSNSCSTISKSHFSTQCNAALFPFAKEEGIIISGIGKSDGDSIDNGRDLIFDPITEELIRKLFEEKNFNSFTFNSNIIFKNSLFEVNYTPFYLLADLYLFNPAFPEISLHAVNRETLRITRGWSLFGDPKRDDEWVLTFGSSLYYYKHTYTNSVFSLFELSFTPPDELIKFNTLYGVAGDLSFFLYNPYDYMPSLSFQVRNIGTKVTSSDSLKSSSVHQSPYLLFEPYGIMGLGKGISTVYGRFDFNYELPFSSYDNRINANYSTLGLNYSLKLVSLYGSIGKYYRNAGLRFDSQTFKVGIGYSSEDDMGELQPSTEKSVYTGIGITL